MTASEAESPILHLVLSSVLLQLTRLALILNPIQSFVSVSNASMIIQYHGNDRLFHISCYLPYHCPSFLLSCAPAQAPDFIDLLFLPLYFASLHDPSLNSTLFSFLHPVSILMLYSALYASFSAFLVFGTTIHVFLQVSG